MCYGSGDGGCLRTDFDGGNADFRIFDVDLQNLFEFIAVAFARPRSGSTLSIDYLGIIVSILGIMTTILLGYQLYNAFKIKEEADKVKALAKKIKSRAII